MLNRSPLTALGQLTLFLAGSKRLSLWRGGGLQKPPVLSRDGIPTDFDGTNGIRFPSMEASFWTPKNSKSQHGGMGGNKNSQYVWLIMKDMNALVTSRTPCLWTDFDGTKPFDSELIDFRHKGLFNMFSENHRRMQIANFPTCLPRSPPGAAPAAFSPKCAPSDAQWKVSASSRVWWSKLKYWNELHSKNLNEGKASEPRQE